ncbi:MFS transporter [Kitasatospora sp. NBC_01287]|uniref:MFS transporter n=1 Tax=Kitasatospora sp. NBC_01287 TaxID=2903573 RepID=UPI002254032E|nr:MFS transporter [Kitasatospora sp. NBC_01287]MCX4751602.1 MFS transporter [Kitasatospora sp. NBC_01287]
MTTETVSDQGSVPRTSREPWALALTAIVGAEFMLQLDGTVVNVALPTLQHDLGVSVSTGTWVPNAFFLAFGGLLLFAGRLGDVLGHRRVFLSGIALVVAASLLAGLAPNLPVLLVGRALQGAGAAVAGPTGLALLAIVFEGERRQRAFGLYSTVTGLGASAGMLLGGLLTWAGDWRWSLLVNVPVGLAIIAVAVRALGTGPGETRARSLALPSAVLVTLAVATAVYGIVHAAGQGWGAVGSWLPLVASALLWAVLAAVDSRAADPLLPRQVFADRQRAGAFVNLLLLAAVLTGFLIYLVQYLQNVLGYNALESGLAILPFGAALLATTQLLTKHLAKLGLVTRALAGLVVILAGVAWLSGLGATSSYASGVLPQIILIGVGVGVAIIPINMIILTTVPPEYAGVTAGLLQTALTIGGSLGLAVLLFPLASGSGGLATHISSVFAWAAGITVLAILVSVAFWVRPKARDTGAAAG